MICPVVSNRFSLRSTYIAAVLNIPDPLSLDVKKGECEIAEKREHIVKKKNFFFEPEEEEKRAA